jgi:phosphatidylcholine synthase
MRPTSSRWRQLRAGAVHVYTASGAVLALLIVRAAVEGDVTRALWLGLAALVVDGTDGMLARACDVKAELPWFDGARLDDIVDFLTYVFAPVVLLLQNGYLPDGTLGTVLAAVPLLASGYQFCRSDAKTEDHLFLGFPSYWNVVAFYAVVLDLGPATVSGVLVVCAVLVFVPLGYLYPSRTVPYRTLSLALTAVWLVSYAVLLTELPDPSPFWVGLSVLYLCYYVGVSLWLEGRKQVRLGRPATRREARADEAQRPATALPE